MKRIKKLLMWYCMFTKRLFKHYSFIIILLLIPVIIPIANNIMSEDGGMIRVGLVRYAEDGAAKEITDALMNEDSVIKYSLYTSESEAMDAVKKEEIDAAWIFDMTLDEKIQAFAEKKSVMPFVRIIQREENIPLRLSYEKLYGALYPHITYYMYRDYVYKKISTPEEIPESVLQYTNKSMDEYDNIIKIKRLDSDEEVTLNNNFLTIPLRGLLSIVVFLCSIAAAMYFLQDSAAGKFDWMAPKKRLIPAFGSCFSASAASGAAVLAALILSGIFTKPAEELAAMILYITASAGFCLILCVLFRSSGKLGASIPFFIITTLVLCPIFFNLNILKPVRFILPVFYYLQSLYDKKYMIYFVIYCLCLYGTAYVLNQALNIRDRRISD